MAAACALAILPGTGCINENAAFARFADVGAAGQVDLAPIAATDADVGSGDSDAIVDGDAEADATVGAELGAVFDEEQTTNEVMAEDQGVEDVEAGDDFEIDAVSETAEDIPLPDVLGDAVAPDVPKPDTAWTDGSSSGETAAAGAKNGEKCSADGDCQLKNCADGVCCASKCAGLCQSCGMGTCAKTTGAELAGKCFGDMVCNADGACVERAKAVAVGAGHVCALTKAGHVWCWGLNDHGQLGDGTTTNRPTAVQVKGLPGEVLQVAAGYYHTCALIKGGTVQCWGLGKAIGPADSADSLAPSALIGYSGTATSIFAGGTSSCIVASGTVWCVGSGLCSPQGGGNNQSESLMAFSQLPNDVSAVAMTDQTGCARMVGGVVQCWGQLESGAGFKAPTVVGSALPNSAWIWLSPNGSACLAAASGVVTCWGMNWGGLLGTPTNTDKWLPATPIIASGAAEVCGTTGEICARLTNGQMQCWGSNTLGESGAGTFGVPTPLPQAVLGVPGTVTAIGARQSTVCAVTATGAVWCWGGNTKGQLGDSETGGSTAPVVISGFGSGSVKSLHARGTAGTSTAATYAVTNGGELYVWGYAAVGDGKPSTYSFVPKKFLGVPANVANVAIVDGKIGINGAGCANLANGDVWCWGNEWITGNGYTPQDLTSLLPVKSNIQGIVRVGPARPDGIIALKANGDSLFWGGQLPEPQSGANITGKVVSVFGQSNGGNPDSLLACALTEGGALVCWGPGGAKAAGNPPIDPKWIGPIYSIPPAHPA